MEQPHSPTPSPAPRWPAPPPRRGPSRALVVALVLGALASALSSLRAPRAAGASPAGARVAWSEGARVRGPFGSSVGLQGSVAGGASGGLPSLRLRLVLDLSSPGEGERR
jgi:hypothetical protein